MAWLSWCGILYYESICIGIQPTLEKNGEGERWSMIHISTQVLPVSIHWKVIHSDENIMYELQNVYKYPVACGIYK